MLKGGQCAAGSLNFRDVMLAYGKLSKDLMSHGHGGHQIGLEFSGKVCILHTASALQYCMCSRINLRCFPGGVLMVKPVAWAP